MIVVPIVAKTSQEALRQAQQSDGDLVELRLDAMDDVSLNLLGPGLSGLRAIVTNRRQAEGGMKAQTDRDRVWQLMDALVLKPWAVDIESATQKRLKNLLIKTAHRQGVLVIESFHDFEKTPSLEKLISLAESALKEADFFKCACKPKNENDLRALLRLVRLRPGRVVSFGLGDNASFSRVFSLKLGAPFGFARGTHATAPGQISVSEMRQAVESFDTHSVWKSLCQKWDFGALKNDPLQDASKSDVAIKPEGTLPVAGGSSRP